MTPATIWRSLRSPWQRATCLFLGLTLLACGDGTDVALDTAVTIDDTHVAYGAFERYLATNADGGGQAAVQLDDVVLGRLFDTFVDERLLVRLAEDLGLTDDPAEDQRRVIERLVRQVSAQPPSRVEIERYYTQHRSRWSHPDQVHLWQILMVDRDRAEGIKQRLDDGADFKETAAGLVDDPDANYCGDQGWLSRADLPPSFAGLIFGLAPGTYSDVVAADYGFYLFWVEARKAAQVEPLDAVEGRIRTAMAHERADRATAEAIEEARTRYTVRVFPTNLPFDYQGRYAERQED